MSYTQLQCPECGMQNILSLQAVASRGRTLDPDIVCARCGADLYLHHTRPNPEDPPEWELVNERRHTIEA